MCSHSGTLSTQVIQSAASHNHQNKNHHSDAVHNPPLNPETEPSYIELEECLKYFPTIKVLSSNRKVPVMLVYGERSHRTSHRHQEKGKSNKVIFPKEKREFLEVMGLPGKMITKAGLDFTVKPEIDLSGIRIHYTPTRSRSSTMNSQNEDDSDYENYDSVMETVIDSVNQLTVDEELSPTKTKRRPSAINMLKKPSISPLPNEKGSGSRKSTGKKSGRKKKPIVIPPDDPDIRSMMTCDSCSSSDEYESDSDVCEQDVAVPSNYAHVENLQPGPFNGLDLTYFTFELEKIAVQSARTMVSPFLRISVRGNYYLNLMHLHIW